MRGTWALGLFALALLAAPALMAEGDATTGIQWTDDLPKAYETAKADKKYVFIEFTATW